MAEFIAGACGSGSSTTRQGTKESGAEAWVQSWHGSVGVELVVDRTREVKASAPTRPQDILVSITVAPGSKSMPSGRIFYGKLESLVRLLTEKKASSSIAKLQLPKPEDGWRMTHEEFEEQYTNKVTFVCKCGGEIVMGMCVNWEDVADGVVNPHYSFR